MFKPTAMFAIPSKPSDDLSEILPRLFAAILSDGPLKGCDCPKCAAQTKTDDNDDTDSHDVTPVDDASQPKRSGMHFGHRYYLRIVQMELALDADGHSPMLQFLSVIAEPICRIHSVMGYHGWPKPPDRERSTLILERTPFLK